MTLKVAILTVLRDADLRGATLAVLTPHVRAQALGEAWTRQEIDAELAKLAGQGLVAWRLDKLQECRRYYITSQGQAAIIEV